MTLYNKMYILFYFLFKEWKNSKSILLTKQILHNYAAGMKNLIINE